MQLVQYLPGLLAEPHAIQEWLIASPPIVGEGGGIDGQTVLSGDGSQLRHDAAAPVDDGPEDVEGEYLEIGPIAAGHAPTRLALRQLQVGAIDRVLRMSQDVEQPRVEWDEDAIEVGLGLLQRLRPRLSIRGDLDAPPALRS